MVKIILDSMSTFAGDFFKMFFSVSSTENFVRVPNFIIKVACAHNGNWTYKKVILIFKPPEDHK